jgi:hypothetical protein
LSYISTSLGWLFFGDFSYLIKQAPLPPASGMEVDDRDEYDRMLEEAEYLHGFFGRE